PLRTCPYQFRLDEMLNDLARHYDSEVELAVEELTEWIGPILIMALGVVVLFFALSIFLPMWDLVKLVQ
ncbi:type II secretion system F family protein, partial [Duodenibacillus massiliensis]|uniref:type II secretion system F family protein n=1 Tax=Duodenibacillus massiliensis TaxID=1852381 RepID=UPI002FD95A65